MKPNTTVIVILTLLVAAFAYWYFFTGTGNEAPLVATDAPTNQAQMQFETLVGELQPVSFNTKIFSDARFNALVNISTPISPESIGRLDPFAALSGGSVGSAPLTVVATPPPAPVTSPATSSETGTPAQ